MFICDLHIKEFTVHRGVFVTLSLSSRLLETTPQNTSLRGFRILNLE